MRKCICNLLLLMLAVFLTASCNDDEGVTPETPKLLLAKIESKGFTVMELEYNIDRRLSRVKYFLYGDALSSDLVEYDTEGIQEVRRYSADDNEMFSKSVMTLDNVGRIVKSETYNSINDFQNPLSEHELVYDPSGQVISRRFQYFGDNPSLTEFIYGAPNHPVKKTLTWNLGTPNEYIISQTDFTIGDYAIYSHWTNDVLLLGLVGQEDYVWEMFNVSTHVQTWNKDGETVGLRYTDASEREYNKEGYLIRQVLTEKNLLKQEADVVREMTYQYVK